MVELPEHQKGKWLQAAEEEFESWQKKLPWTFTKLSPEEKAIGCKWVFKLKHNMDGSVEKYKVCFVSKGYTQRHGDDFLEFISPVVKYTSIRTLLSIAASMHVQDRQTE